MASIKEMYKYISKSHVQLESDILWLYGTLLILLANWETLCFGFPVVNILDITNKSEELGGDPEMSAGKTK